MTAEKLIALGKARSRPCLQLYPTVNEPVAGVWGGAGVLRSPGQFFKHRCSVNLDALQFLGLAHQGWIGLYRNSETSSWLAIIGDPVQSIVACGGESLTARESASLPPLDQLFASADEEILAWSHDGFFNADLASKTDAGREYEREFASQCPVYEADPEAVLQIGGWHLMWPDSNDYYEFGDQILIWTFRDSEPWLEVWPRDGDFVVVPRIT